MYCIIIMYCTYITQIFVIFYKCYAIIVTESEIILDAMREWEDKTCVRFRRRNKETSYLHFFKGFG